MWLPWPVKNLQKLFLRETLQRCFDDATLETVLILNSRGNLRLIDIPAGIIVSTIDSVAELAGVYDLAIVFDELEDMAEGEVTRLLGTLRNRYCQRLLVCSRLPLGITAMRALGFARGEPLCGRDVFTYDIDTYNEERAWNNSEDWAHPQSYDKRRY